MSQANLRALIVTGLLMAGYFGLQWIPVPYAPSYNLMTLGVKPAFGMFLFVELLSCILPPLTNFRRQGFAGRRKLNVLALLLAILVAATQGYFGARTELMYPDTILPGDGLYSDAAETQFNLTVITSLVAGAIVATGLAHAITRSGLANGFSLLMLCDSLWFFVTMSMSQTPDGEELGPREFDLTRPLILGAGLAAAVWFLRQRRIVAAHTQEGSDIEIAIPPVPQSLVAASYLYLASTTLSLAVGHPWTFSPWLEMAGLLLSGVPLLSWILYHAFSSPGRVSRAIQGRVRINDSATATLVQQTWIAAGVMIASPLALAIFDSLSRTPYVRSWPSVWISTAVSLIAVAALSLDVFDLWMFRQRVQEPVRLFDLDNVHVASCAQAMLRQKGIDCCLQGFQHRRLLFHFGAAIKISLHVPADQADAAREVLRIEQFALL